MENKIAVIKAVCDAMW